MTPKKFTEKELTEIQSLRDEFIKKIQQFGQIEIEILTATQHLDKLKNAKQSYMQEYEELQEKERNIITTLSEKYGTGILDLEKGEFVPDSE